MTTTEQNEKIDQALLTLRSLGYAVVAFTPDELGANSTEDLEDYLTERGWDWISMSDVAP